MCVSISDKVVKQKRLICFEQQQSCRFVLSLFRLFTQSEISISYAHLYHREQEKDSFYLFAWVENNYCSGYNNSNDLGGQYPMQKIGKRLKYLRDSFGLSQEEMAVAIGSTQSSINRYENGQSNIPVTMLRQYAEYLDVSLDYIFARTDKPQGMTYQFNPQHTPEKEEMRRFIEMCFDPESPMRDKLKETLFHMMEGE